MHASRSNIAFVLATLSFMPTLASAHPETMLATGGSGFLHPLTGLDHLLAMFAVGLWAARLRGAALFAFPAAFPLAMIGGALAALAGWALPAVEPMIATSVIVLGIAVASGVKVPVGAGVALVAAFAIFHGYAHATEAPQDVLPYGVGFVLATVLLHLVGMLVGFAFQERTRALQLGGSAIAVAGLAMVLG